MAWFAQTQFNLGEVSPSASIKPESLATIAGLKEFENGIVTYDGEMQKRFGCRVTNFSDVELTGTSIAFNFSPKTKDYCIVLSSEDAIGRKGIRIYERQGGTWFTSPIPFFFLDESPYLGDFTDIPVGGVFNRAPHPYTESELKDVTAVAYGDKFFLLHNNYMPILLQPDKNRFGNFLFFEAWKWTHRPFGTGPEIRSFRKPILFTLSTRSSASYGRMTASYPVFKDSMNPLPNGAQFQLFGAIWRVGQAQIDGQEEGAKFGQFWQIERALGVSSADVKIIPAGAYTPSITVEPTLGGTGRFEDQSEPDDWAGPWIDSGTQITVTVPPTNNGQTFQYVSATVGRERIGEIWYVQNVLNQVAGAFLVVDSPLGGGSLTLANIGPDITVSTVFDGVLNPRLHIMRLPDGDETCIFPEYKRPELLTDSADRMKFWDGDGLPIGHQTAFEKTKVTPNGATTDVGGAVFVGGGVFRVQARETPTATTGDSAVSWRGYWEKEPGSAAPCSNWGYGWSKATGFPDVGEVHQQRLVLAGFSAPGAAVVASAPDRPEDINALEFPELDDSPLNISSISGDEGERVRWMKSTNENLFIGTTGGEYSLRGAPLSAQSIGVEPHSKYGSGKKPGGVATVGPAAAFIAEGGNTVREMQADGDSGQFVSPNILATASHILQSGETYDQIVGVNFIHPFYALRTSLGRLVFLSRDHESQIAAPSVATVVSDDSSRTCEHIWIQRGDDQNETLWASWKITTPQAGQVENKLVQYDRTIYTDFQETPASYATTSVTLPSWMAGMEVEVVHNGIYWGNYRVPSIGNLTFQFPFPENTSTLTVGQSYTFKGAPTMKDIVRQGFGTTLGQIRNISKVQLYLVNSQGGNIVEDNSSQISPINLRSAAPTTANGWVDIPGASVNGNDPTLSIQSRHPFPFRVSAITMEVSMK